MPRLSGPVLYCPKSWCMTLPCDGTAPLCQDRTWWSKYFGSPFQSCHILSYVDSLLIFIDVYWYFYKIHLVICCGQVDWRSNVGGWNMLKDIGREWKRGTTCSTAHKLTQVSMFRFKVWNWFLYGKRLCKACSQWRRDVYGKAQSVRNTCAWGFSNRTRTGDHRWVGTICYCIYIYIQCLLCIIYLYIPDHMWVKMQSVYKVLCYATCISPCILI